MTQSQDGHTHESKVRACPICPKCGGKKFDRLQDTKAVKLRCTSCKKISEI